MGGSPPNKPEAQNLRPATHAFISFILFIQA
jgi:hypothetical protein